MRIEILQDGDEGPFEIRVFMGPTNAFYCIEIPYADRAELVKFNSDLGQVLMKKPRAQFGWHRKLQGER